MRILITGITGFAGSHLAEHALKMGAQVWGTIRSFRSPVTNIKHLLDSVDLFECDVTDQSSVNAAMAATKPDWVFGLAAQSYVKSSFDDPTATMRTNVQGQINLLECMRKKMFGQFLSIGSSEEYGFVRPEETPITEDNPLRPLSPYAVSKVAQDLLAYQYHKSYGLHIIRARAFNHTGPRRGEVFVSSNFAKQIAEIECRKTSSVINHGNLEAVRDFTDVRDTVRAYWLLMEKGRPGEVYNIASGEGHKISQVLHQLWLKSSEIGGIAFSEDAARMRPSDVPILIGCARKLEGETGWTREFSFDQTLTDLLEYWREKIKP